MDASIATYSAPPATARTQPALETAASAPPPVAPPTAAPTAGRQPSYAETERKVEFDAPTGSLIYRSVDVASGVTVVQTPNEARLRLRAYLDSMGNGAAKPALELTA